MISENAARPNKKLVARVKTLFNLRGTKADSTAESYLKMLMEYSNEKLLNTEALDNFLNFLKTDQDLPAAQTAQMLDQIKKIHSKQGKPMELLALLRGFRFKVPAQKKTRTPVEHMTETRQPRQPRDPKPQTSTTKDVVEYKGIGFKLLPGAPKHTARELPKIIRSWGTLESRLLFRENFDPSGSVLLDFGGEQFETNLPALQKLDAAPEIYIKRYGTPAAKERLKEVQKTASADLSDDQMRVELISAGYLDQARKRVAPALIRQMYDSLVAARKINRNATSPFIDAVVEQKHFEKLLKQRYGKYKKEAKTMIVDGKETMVDRYLSGEKLVATYIEGRATITADKY